MAGAESGLHAPLCASWILLSAAAALVLWMVAVPIAGMTLTVGFGGRPEMAITPGMVLVSAIIPGLIAWALLVVLRHYFAGAAKIWTIVAAVVLVLSMAAPLSAEAMAGTKVILALMHIAVAAVLVPGLLRTLPVQSAKRGVGQKSRTA